MTTALTLDPPARARTSGTRAVIVALVTGCLTLAGVIAIGWYTSFDQRNAMSAGNTQPYTVPSAAWADGAQEVWEMSVAADAEVVTAGSWLITVERDRQADTSAVLVGYEVSETGTAQRWSTTADLTQGSTVGAGFQLWAGTTLVHGTTLIDLATGSVSAAPWSAADAALVVDDRVITCSDTQGCRGWAPGLHVPAWTAPVTGGLTPLDQDTGRAPVLHRAGQRYAVVGHHTVVNIDTGQSVHLELPALQSWTVLSTAEGWAVLSRDTGGSAGHVYEFDIGGGAPVDDYSVTNAVEEGQVPLSGPEPLTRQDLRALWLDGDNSSVIAWGGRESPTSSCLVTVRRGDGPTIEIPNLMGAPEGVISAGSSCAEEVIVSGDHHLVGVQLKPRPTENAFALFYDGATGERIDFPGTDPLDAATYSLVTEDLIIGYDAASGVIHGYVPAGAAAGDQQPASGPRPSEGLTDGVGPLSITP